MPSLIAEHGGCLLDTTTVSAVGTAMWTVMRNQPLFGAVILVVVANYCRFAIHNKLFVVLSVSNESTHRLQEATDRLSVVRQRAIGQASIRAAR